MTKQATWLKAYGNAIRAGKNDKSARLIADDTLDRLERAYKQRC